MTEDKKIDLFRKVFTISVSAFTMQNEASKAFGGSGNISKMHQLHLMAKEEVFKENPSLEKVDLLLHEMEILAEELKTTPKQSI